MEYISAVIHYLGEFNMVSVMLRLVLAVIAGGIIGNERGRHGRAAGLRTHILVCLGGALTSLISLYCFYIRGIGGDIFRIPASVVSGIGFLGAGIIMVRNSNTVAGLTTAAGMWVTAIIGVAIGYGFYAGGVVTTLICIINATLLTKVEHNRIRATSFYIEVHDMAKIHDVLEEVETVLNNDAFVEVTSAKSGIVGSIGFEVTTSNRGNMDEIRKTLGKIDGVSYVVSE